MKSLLSIWRAMTGAERVVAGAALLALGSCVVFAALALGGRPGDISNPDAEFKAEKGPGKAIKPPKDKTIDWPRFGYDPGRSKFLDAQRIRPPFAKVWKYKGDELIEFPPIVVDDRLYFIDNDGLYVCLDANTGKVLWDERLSNLNASSPAYYDGVLYTVSLDPGQAIAVRARDGKVLWRKDLGARAESSPLVIRDRMFFGDESGAFHALDIKDGSEIWTAQVEGSVKAAPAMSDGTLYFGDYGGYMNAVRASDGEIVWQTQDLGVELGGSGRIYSTAAVAFGRVYAGDVDNKIYSFDEDNGEIAWTHSAGGYVYSGVAAAKTKGTKPAVYVGSHDRNVYALEADDGDVIWQEHAGGQISGPATVVGDVVYVSTFSGDATIGLDLGTGRRVFSFDEGEYGPVVSDNEKLYLTGGTTVTAFVPIDIGDAKYDPKKGQRGIVPPKRRRQIAKRMRNGGAEGGPAPAKPAEQGSPPEANPPAEPKPPAKPKPSKAAKPKPSAKRGKAADRKRPAKAKRGDQGNRKGR